MVRWDWRWCSDRGHRHFLKRWGGRRRWVYFPVFWTLSAFVWVLSFISSSLPDWSIRFFKNKISSTLSTFYIQNLFGNCYLVNKIWINWCIIKYSFFGLTKFSIFKPWLQPTEMLIYRIKFSLKCTILYKSKTIYQFQGKLYKINSTYYIFRIGIKINFL